MATDSELKLALRIQTHLEQARADLRAFVDDIRNVGAATDNASSADQRATSSREKTTRATREAAQETRDLAETIKQETEAQQQAGTSRRKIIQATEQATRTNDDLNRSLKVSNTDWRATVQRQDEAIRRYHQAQQEQERLAAQERAEAEAAAQAAAEKERQDAALQKLRGQIDATERALQRLDIQEQELSRHFERGAITLEEYDAYLAKIQQRRNVLNGVSENAGAAALQMTSLNRTVQQFRNLLYIGASGFGIVSLAKSVVDTNLAWQQAVYTMRAATGSEQAAAREMDYVKQKANELGLQLLSTSQSFARLLASAKSTPELLPQMNAIFDGVARATTALHLAPREVNGILNALEQMVSKGKVQTQELVLQLGQLIPGAFEIAAKSLNTNTAQLSQWLQKGLIPPTEFLPRFAAALKEAYGPGSQQAAHGLQAELNRLDNSWTLLKVHAGDAGFIDSFTQSIRDLTKTLNDPNTAQGFNAMITALGKVVNVSVKALAGVANLTKFIGEEVAYHVNGPAADDPARLDSAIAAAEKRLVALRHDAESAFVKGDNKTFATLTTEANRVEKQIRDWRQLLKDYYSHPTPDSSSGAGGKGGSGGNKPPNPPFKPKGTDKTNERFVQQLEREATAAKAGKAAAREYDIAQHHLTGTLLKRAQAADATLKATEKAKQQAKDDKTLADAQSSLLQIHGQGGQAEITKLEAKYKALLERLKKEGNQAGIDLVHRMINVKAAQAQMKDLQAAVQRILGDQQRQEQTIQAQQQAGLINDITARQRLVQLHKQTADQLDKLVPKMQQLAAATGDPKALERVAQLRNQIQQLRIVTNQFELTVKQAFEQGLADGLQKLAEGAQNVQDTIRNIVKGIADAIAKLEAEQLAKEATQSIQNALTTTSKATAETAAATAGAAAMGTAISTASSAGSAVISTGISTSLAAGSATLSGGMAASFAAGAATLTAALSTAFSVGAAEISAASAGSAAVGAATGGHITGPGGPTTDSIPAWLSNNEYVIRAASVTQPGALAFLHQFNRHGMGALRGFQRFATGGLVSPRAMSIQSPAVSLATHVPAPVVRQRLLPILDDQTIADALKGDAGEKLIELHLTRRPGKFKSILSGGK